MSEGNEAGPQQFPRSLKDFTKQSEATTKWATDSWAKHTARWNGLLDKSLDQQLEAKHVTTAYTECLEQIVADTADWIELWWPGGGGSPKAPDGSIETFQVTAAGDSGLAVLDCCNVNDADMKLKVDFDQKAVPQGTSTVTVRVVDAEGCVNGLYELDFELNPVDGSAPVHLSRTISLDLHPA